METASRFLGLAAILLMTWSVGNAQHSREWELANRHTVRIISGSASGTYAQFAQDISDALDRPHHLRVLPVLGKGSRQNLTDLVYLDGIDAAIVQADVLEAIRLSGDHDKIVRHISYVLRLYEEEVHVLVGGDIRSIQDLEGKKVGTGPEGSGTAMTAERVFQALGISMDAVHGSYERALSDLTAERISGMVMVVGKPADTFSVIPESAGLHFIGVPRQGSLEQDYRHATLDHADYPKIIGVGTEVSTISVDSVFAVYDWDPAEHGRRYINTKNLVEDLLCSSVNELSQVDGYHPKWGKIDPTSTVPGWRRFAPAEQWVERHCKPAHRTIGTDERSPFSRGSLQDILAEGSGDGIGSYGGFGGQAGEAVGSTIPDNLSSLFGRSASPCRCPVE